MKRIAAIAVLLLPSLLHAQNVIYEIRFEGADHHEAEVTARFTDVPPGRLELRMSRSSPGRYALHEFAKNVYDVRATDGAGRALVVSRPDPHGWIVDGHRGVVHVSYTIFGDRADGTYLAIDNTHAHMNMPATFLWARGTETRRISLRIVPPRDDWRVATQLKPTADDYVFEAPNLYYFLDSPTEVSAHELHEWRQGSQTIRLALHHQGSHEQGEAFARLAAAVVREQEAIFGELPEFDYGTYTFLADYLPYASGDGMEHRNSTVLSSTRSLDQALRNIGTVSHEFFHAWNVERLRPRSLEPFDFERANMSDALWFAEGFTSYYDDLTLKRAGIFNLDRYVRAVSGNLNSILNAPGRDLFSPVAMSRRAPFVDAAVSVDPTNRHNIFASYYPYGAVVGLALDLTLRTRFPGKTLDDFMKASWQTYGTTEKPYEIVDLETMLSEVTGDVTFAKEFFGRYVYESALPDFEPLLARAGLELRLAREGSATLGAFLREEDGRVVVRTTTRGGPAYVAGLDRGDVLLSIAGKGVSGVQQVSELLAAHAPGDTVEVVFDKRGETRTELVSLVQDPRIEVVTYEAAGKRLTEEMQAFRESWLTSRAAHDESLERYCHRCGRAFGVEKDYCAYDGEALRLTPP